MKYLQFIFILCIGLQLNAQNDFYYYKDGKMPLNVNNQYAYILCNLSDQNALQKKLSGMATVIKFHQDIYQARLIKKYQNSEPRMANINNYYAEIKFNDTALSYVQVSEILKQIKAMPEIINISPSYNVDVNSHFSITNYVWVGLKNEDQIPVLISEVNKINYSLVGQNPFMPEWVMICPKQNAVISQVKAAQILTETGLFTVAEPELIGGYKTNCTNDPLFANQWGFNNTGQFGGTAGMDTRLCSAYNTTTGSNAVDVAVIDEGFENNHPDLDGNLQNTGYNTKLATTPSVVFGSHGTACAGIVAAEGNNSLGVTGVAYGADLMSIAMDFSTLTNAQIADGFNWSRINGAEVMSNSWGGGGASAVINTAITNALTLGRGGLGCVVVFATANDNAGTISYPANSNPDIIAVGAMSMCGQRKNPASCDGENWWGSNYGAGMDVVAPGVHIYTTDRQGNAGYNTSGGVAGDYVTNFNGTSSACPHAAGIAALILSVNPCLTQHEVEMIMHVTARKVGGYSYAVNGLYPDGTWNNEMGYGLLDADAAVKMAHTLYLQNKTETGTAIRRALYIKAGNNVNNLVPAGDYNTSAGANINIIGTFSIEMEAGTDLQGTVDAYLDPNCQ
jgi:subtilisin family serine protease